MASFSALGGALQAVATGTPDPEIIALLARKPPAESLGLAVTANKLHLARLVDLLVRALFDSAPKEAFQASLKLEDDLYVRAQSSLPAFSRLPSLAPTTATRRRSAARGPTHDLPTCRRDRVQQISAPVD